MQAERLFQSLGSQGLALEVAVMEKYTLPHARCRARWRWRRLCAVKGTDLLQNDADVQADGAHA